MPRTLEEAFARVIHSRRVTELAAEIGLPLKALYRYATGPENASDEHRDPPAKIIAPLTLATGRLDVLEVLAGQVGCLVVRRPAPARTGPALLGQVAAVTREFADVQRCAAQMFADGRITAVEISAIDQELAELEREAETLRHALARAPAAERKPLARAGAR
ncbi:MAG: hypothetical protein HY727_15080 [Candidatus Rokubacteria bacterium]|nr:hypothetical protein [Candidatus Rokubacteria bacterium]